MRTKHILTALALPALFTACTADDFSEVVNNGTTAERAQLSEDFKLYFGGNTNSRFSAGEPGKGLSFSYETGDSIGGAIIDTYTPAGGYVVQDYISTNHPFVLDASGEWTINHTMVEGNYLFYYPYNQNNHERGAIRYSIPVMQDLSGKDGKFDPKAAVEKYNMGVGAQFLDKNDLSASLQLVNLYGYAKIKVTLDNRYAGGNVDKIVLNRDGKFKLNGQISNKKVSDLFAILEKSSEDYKAALDKMTTTADFCLETEEDYYVPELNETSQVMVAKAPEGTALEVDAQNNKSFETYLVLPAQDLKNVQVYLYTTDGNVYASDYQDLTVARNTIKTFEVNAARTENIPYVVTSTKDWNDYVALLKKNSTANFIIAGEDFTVTNDVKYPTNGANINVTGTLKVSGNDVTIKNVTAGSVIVEEGAKLTTDGTFKADMIENNGTLNIAPAYNDKNEVTSYSEIEYVSNQPGATMIVDKDAQADFVLINAIDIDDKALPYGTVEINGQLTLNAGSYNNGLITNNGSLRGTFTNSAEYIYPNGATGDDIKNRFTPAIVNNKEIFATGAVVNDGTVENKKGAEITCSKLTGSATFTNKGTIELADGSRMLITDNASGEVLLETLNQTNWSIEGTKGIVAYETGAADVDKSYDFTSTGKGITKLYVNGNLGITKMGDINAIVVASDATLALAKGTSFGNLTVEEDVDAIIASSQATVADMNVKEGATVTINKDNNLLATNVLNAGTVYVGGTFTTETTEKNAVTGNGVFKSTSSDDTNIKFGDENAGFNQAVAELVNAWLKNTSKIGTSIDSWSEIDAEAIAGSNWTLGSSWVKDATDAFEQATGIPATGIATILTANEAAVNAALTTAKNEADGRLATAIAAMDNTWVGLEVYEKTAADQALKDITDLTDGFKTYINGEYATSVATDKPLYLSAKDYSNVTSVPAYSYIETYETADVYKAVKLWKEASTSYESEAWYTATITYEYNSTTTSNNTLSKLKKYFNEMNKAYAENKNDLLLQQELKPFADMVSTVITWNYTDKQIQTLGGMID